MKTILKVQLTKFDRRVVMQVLEQADYEAICDAMGGTLKVDVACSPALNNNSVFLNGENGCPDVIVRSNRRKTNDDRDDYFAKIIKSLSVWAGKVAGGEGGPQPERGDVVFVRQEDTKEWCSRIFLYDLGNNCSHRYICVVDGNEDLYRDGRRAMPAFWSHLKTKANIKVSQVGDVYTWSIKR